MQPTVASDYASKTVSEIIDALALGTNGVPLTALRENVRQLPEVLRVPILLIALDSELLMNGILGFLENSTGRYLWETIEALTLISAQETTNTLKAIGQIMERSGVLPSILRADVDQARLHEVTSFSQLHGELAGRIASEIAEKATALYVYRGANGERVFDLLCAYLEPRRDELLAALRAAEC